MELNGKTALVTGATSGIGKVAARELAQAGYRVIVTARDRARGDRTLEDIRAASGNEALELHIGDLSSMEDVRRIAVAVRESHPRLDLLVNNAGGVFVERRTTVEGIERSFALNHLAYFLMTNLLLEPLMAASRARVVSVSSDASSIGRVRWADIESRRGYMGFTAYAQSKLMNLLFAFALARRLKGSGATSNALHPGVVKSGFWDHGNWMTRPVFGLIKRFAGVTPERGADTLLFLATSPEVDGVTGRFFQDRRERRVNPLALDESAQERLWSMSEHYVGRWLDREGATATGRPG